jgi:mRNA interferase MazF
VSRQSCSSSWASPLNRGEVVWLRSLRGTKGHEQRGARYAVIVQATELLTLSTVLVAPTSTGAQPASFRPEIEVVGVPTRVMVDHLAAADASRIGETVRMLSWEELDEIERALGIVLGLAR